MQHYNKIFKHIKENKPIFIKGFFSTSTHTESIKEIIELFSKSNDKNEFLKGSRYINCEKNEFVNGVVKKLKTNSHICLDERYRVWNHEKNNITPWHYDGNGIDVINVCLRGKKLFLLSEPQSQITIPFTNITMFENNSFQHKYILEPGDLLLIPRFWFHKVISLKDNTTTINFNSTSDYNNIPSKYKMLFNLHKFFNTRMNLERICNLPKLSIKFESFLYNLLSENIILFVLILVSRMILNVNFNFKISNHLDKFILLSALIEWKYSVDSVGISRLLTVGLLTNNLLIDNLI